MELITLTKIPSNEISVITLNQNQKTVKFKNGVIATIPACKQDPNATLTSDEKFQTTGKNLIGVEIIGNPNETDRIKLENCQKYTVETGALLEPNGRDYITIINGNDKSLFNNVKTDKDDVVWRRSHSMEVLY
jgi:deoxyxylulose-5-phosphate synthase